MKFKVTQQHISLAKEYQKLPHTLMCLWCPLALSIKEKLNLKTVFVAKDKIIIGKNTYQIPKTVKDFTDKFDKYQEAKPFEFELDIIK